MLIGCSHWWYTLQLQPTVYVAPVGAQACNSPYEKAYSFKFKICGLFVEVLYCTHSIFPQFHWKKNIWNHKNVRFFLQSSKNLIWNIHEYCNKLYLCYGNMFRVWRRIKLEIFQQNYAFKANNIVFCFHKIHEIKLNWLKRFVKIVSVAPTCSDMARHVNVCTIMTSSIDRLQFAVCWKLQFHTCIVTFFVLHAWCDKTITAAFTASTSWQLQMHCCIFEFRSNITTKYISQWENE